MLNGLIDGTMVNWDFRVIWWDWIWNYYLFLPSSPPHINLLHEIVCLHVCERMDAVMKWQALCAYVKKCNREGTKVKIQSPNLELANQYSWQLIFWQLMIQWSQITSDLTRKLNTSDSLRLLNHTDAHISDWSLFLTIYTHQVAS